MWSAHLLKTRPTWVTLFKALLSQILHTWKDWNSTKSCMHFIKVSAFHKNTSWQNPNQLYLSQTQLSSVAHSAWSPTLHLPAKGWSLQAHRAPCVSKHEDDSTGCGTTTNIPPNGQRAVDGTHKWAPNFSCQYHSINERWGNEKFTISGCAPRDKETKNIQLLYWVIWDAEIGSNKQTNRPVRRLCILPILFKMQMDATKLTYTIAEICYQIKKLTQHFFQRKWEGKAFVLCISECLCWMNWRTRSKTVSCCKGNSAQARSSGLDDSL